MASSMTTGLVTGATGLLGREVCSQLQRGGCKVIGTGFTRASGDVVKLDLANEADIAELLDDRKPTFIVHCAAHRAPDVVDKDPEAARKLNIEATRALARAAASRSIFLLYISTDYVFPGRPGEAPYASDAPTGPTNFYGQTKLDGEKVVLEGTSHNALGAILRVPVLYGPVSEAKGNAESAVNILLDQLWKAQNETVKMDDWSIRYPTLTSDVGRVCKDICSTFASASSSERKEMKKVLQFSAEERFTKYQICEALAEIMGLPMGQIIANKEGNDPHAAVQRPYDCHLSTAALKNMGINVDAQDFRTWWKWNVKAYKK